MPARSRRARQLPEFEWDAANEEKLLDRHNVSTLEAEQCFANPHTSRDLGGGRLGLFGKTDNGRMLFVCYEQQKSGVVRVISAREMTKKERSAYKRNV